MIDITFENCDSALLSEEDFEQLTLTTVREEKDLLHDRLFTPVVESLIMKIKKKNIENRYTQFYESFSNLKDREESFLIYTRLKDFKDITQIHVSDETGEREKAVYYIHWHDEDEFTNRYQYFSEDEEYITITIKNPDTILELPEQILNVKSVQSSVNLDFVKDVKASIPQACLYCPNHPTNGGTGICHCTVGVQPVMC